MSVTDIVLRTLLKSVSLLPLSAIHCTGAFLGSCAYRFSARYREKMIENLRIAGLDPDQYVHQVKRHLGMQALETPWVWNRTSQDLMRYIESDAGDIEKIQRALASGKSIVFMTVHTGCFELLPLWAYETSLKAHGKTMTVLYREPKMPFLRALVGSVRTRDGMDPAPADLSGVRKILRALKSGGVFGCLPDQVPGKGEGIWVPFFGQWALTMSLPVKLAKQFDAVRFFAWTERIPGKGWRLCVREWTEPLSGNLHDDVARMSRELEKIILSTPEQYVWNYNRYKCPAGEQKPVTPCMKVSDQL